jgi:hypothetical protein
MPHPEPTGEVLSLEEGHMNSARVELDDELGARPKE